MPWRPGDATRLLLLDVVGGATLVGGWLGTSGTAGLARQLSWVSVAVAGLLIAGTGNALWLLAGRRTVGLRLRSLLASYPPDVLGVGAAPAAAEVDLDTPVAVLHGIRYHQPDCLLVRGKPAFPVPAGERLSPCEACLPDLVA